MIITNNSNLPLPFVRMAQKEYEYKPKRYSITTLLKSTREILLLRRHDNEIEQDCSNMVWALFGQLAHKVLEEHATADSEFAEQKLQVVLPNGYEISGIIDLYDKTTQQVVDWKTASVWKVVFGDYEDWRNQGLGYAWLLWKNGLPCKRITFYAILKDWSVGESKRKADYPKQAIHEYSFEVTEEMLLEFEKWLLAKVEEIIVCEQLSDGDLPMCSEKDRWNKGNKYAVMKKGRKTALRVLDDEETAKKWLADNGGDFIEERKGENTKCENYCLACKFCPFWNENYKDKEI